MRGHDVTLLSQCCMSSHSGKGRVLLSRVVQKYPHQVTHIYTLQNAVFTNRCLRVIILSTSKHQRFPSEIGKYVSIIYAWHKNNNEYVFTSLKTSYDKYVYSYSWTDQYKGASWCAESYWMSQHMSMEEILSVKRHMIKIQWLSIFINAAWEISGDLWLST